MQSVERAYAEKRMAEKEADAELVRLAQAGDERLPGAGRQVSAPHRAPCRPLRQACKRRRGGGRTPSCAPTGTRLVSRRCELLQLALSHREQRRLQLPEEKRRRAARRRRALRRRLLRARPDDEQTPERVLLARQIGEVVERAMARPQPSSPRPWFCSRSRASPTRKSRRCSARPSARCARGSSARASSSRAGSSRCSACARQEVVAMSLNVSLLLDGELEPAEVKPALEELAANSGLRDRYTSMASPATRCAQLDSGRRLFDPHLRADEARGREDRARLRPARGLGGRARFALSLVLLEEALA